MTIKDVPPSEKTPRTSLALANDDAELLQDQSLPSSSDALPPQIATPYHIPVAIEATPVAASPYEAVNVATPSRVHEPPPPRVVRRTNRADLTNSYILTIIFGWLGYIHFRTGRYAIGLLYVCTLGGLGLGYIVDLIRLPNLVDAYNNGEDLKRADWVLVGDAYAMYVYGFIGLHQLVLGRPKWALFYLCTMGGLGVGWLVDFFRMATLTPSKIRRLSTGEPCYSVSDAYVAWLPCGLMGAHHFYLGNHGMGWLYFFTFGLLGLGFLVDGVRMASLVDEANLDLAEAIRIKRMSGLSPLLSGTPPGRGTEPNAGLTARQLSQLAKSEIA